MQFVIYFPLILGVVAILVALLKQKVDTQTRNKQRVVIWRTWLFRAGILLIVLQAIFSSIAAVMAHKGSQKTAADLAAIPREIHDDGDKTRAGVKRMEDRFASDPRMPASNRLEVLEEQKTSAQAVISNLSAQQPLIKQERVTLKSLRAQRTNDTEIKKQENTVREAEVKQAEILQTQATEAEKAEVQETRRRRNNQSKDIFNVVIRSLEKILADLAVDSGEDFFTDLGSPRGVEHSNMMLNDRFVKGTNTLCLGTNGHWAFRISCTPFPGRPMLFIRCEGSNTNSVFRINGSFRTFPIDVGYREDGPNSRYEFNSVSLSLTTPDSSTNCAAPLTNYDAVVTSVLREMVFVQDGYFPLPSKR